MYEFGPHLLMGYRKGSGGLLLPRHYRAAARGVRWDELFSGFPGVAYDFTAAGGMTQDRGGLTAVTAAAQSIGLAHDYARDSSGWVSGTELRSVGVTDAVGSPAAATYNSSTGVATVNRVDLNNQSFIRVSGLTANRSYLVTVLVNSGSVLIRTDAPTGTVLQTWAAPAAEPFTVLIRPTTSTVVFSTATAITASFTILSIREITGNPLLAPTDARRPTWGAMANGLPCSVWDGTRAMATAAPVDFTSTDQITVMAAVRSLSNVGTQIIAELSANVYANTGTFVLLRDVQTYLVASRGTATGSGTSANFGQPDNAILVMRARISTDYLELLRNGTQIATSASDQGTGNYGNHILNIGARNAASLFFNGEICRIAAIGGNIGAEREAAMLGLLAAGFAPS